MFELVSPDRLFWFLVTVLPLILTPGRDILLCIAQGLSRGMSGVRRAVGGIALGYGAHAAPAATGVAALVAASPALFETVRWIGVAYLLWLAFGMLRSAWRGEARRGDRGKHGCATALLCGAAS